MRNRFALTLALFFFFALAVGNLLAQAPAATPDENPTGNTGALKSQIETAGSYDPNSGNGTRIVTDLHVPGALGAYGLDFTRYWNSLHNDYENPDAEWPQDFGMSGWSHSWHWTAEYLTVSDPIGGDNGEEIFNTSIIITFPDGHLGKYRIQRSNREHIIPADVRYGPPYSPGEIGAWSNGGTGVHDNLNMAVNGSEFWLCRADGGSVRFTGGTGNYRATEVFDPHGLKTVLHYNNGGLLDQVTQDGGRYLTITWSSFRDAGYVITRVESGGSAGAQYVTYKYRRVNGTFLVLAVVGYGEDAPALYGYSLDYGNPAVQTLSQWPLLKEANDPRYAGAMTQIKYDYSGVACPTPTPAHLEDPPAPTYVLGTPYDVIAEKNSAGVAVSKLARECFSFVRTETNGLGGQRMFYFGLTAGPSEMVDGEMVSCRGYQLGKVTDFYLGSPGSPPPGNVSSHRQKFGRAGHPRKIWDGLDHLTETFHHDESGSPTDISYVDGSTCTYDRNPPSGAPALDSTCMHNTYRHWLFKKKDERGQFTTYTRDARRRVTRIDYPDNSFEEYSYNDFNQVLTHKLPNLNVQRFQYDGSQRLIMTYNDWDYNLSNLDYTEYTYYGPSDYPEWTDLVKTMKDGRARAAGAPFTTRMTYNGRHQVLSVEYAALGGQSIPTVRYEYDTYGNRTAVIDELGHRKDYIYDAYRRQTSCTEQVNGPGPNGTNVASRRTDWIYDRVLDNGASFSAAAHTSKDWRIQIEPEFNANHDRRATARTFDFNNRITSEQTGLVQYSTEPLGNLHTVNGVTGIQRFTYDENGQKQTSTDPLARVTTYGYDNRNRLKTTTEPKRASQATNPVTRFDYDVAGNKKKVTFPDNNTQQWDDYDAFGQAWKFTDERHNVTDLIYEWGPMKKLQTVTTYRQRDNPPGGTETQPTSFEYDGMGRPKKTIFPDSSTEETTYLLGQVWKYKTRRGQTKVIDQYDARGRELHHYWLNYLNAPDGTTPAVTSVWDDASRLTRILNVFSTIDYTYDAAGQVITEGSTVAGSGTGGNGALRQLIYWRYPSGEVAQITYPNGAVVTRGYTARGQLAGVGWSGGSTSFAYLPDGDVDYQAWTNGVTTTYGYDGRGMIGSVLHRNIPMNQDLAKREYWRNDRDQILAWKRGIVPVPNAMENGRGDRFGYDEEGQLTSASYRAEDPAGAATGAMRAEVFEYDKMGNRMGTHDLAGRGATNFTRDNNGLNQYASWTPSVIKQDDDMGGDWGSPGHANGVTMQEGWITASYNALNQPMAMWCPTYGSSFLWFGYDPLGRCVKRWMGSDTGNAPNSNPATYLYYDGLDLVQEGSSAMIATRIYVHGAGVDQIVASQVVSTGEWRYHHYDGQGNCILLTDTNGAIREQYDYDAFGLPYFYGVSGGRLGTAAQWGNRFLFTGREWLQDLRIYDYRARQYQPELGRFLQPDPKEFAAGDYNLYRYCHNDPVNRMDPTGLQDSGSDELLNKPNLTSFGQGDWMQPGSPFTKGEMLSKAKNYVGEVKSAVNKAVDKANKNSRNVTWSANVSNWIKNSDYFKSPRTIATTDWSTKSTAVMNAGAVASFNVNLQININWNAGRSASFGSALRTDVFGLFWKTGEIEHSRDALRALTSPYGGARPAVDIANERAAGMVGQGIPEGAASSRMNAALMPWADATMNQSRIDHDQFGGDHIY